VKVPTAAYFREYIKAEVPLRRIYLLSTRVNKDKKKGRGLRTGFNT